MRRRRAESVGPQRCDLLFRASLLSDPDDPSLYGDRVAAYVMATPYGSNIDDPEDWANLERLLGRLP